jgi:1-acyl-sn-glycerol-3-phosphate acyltransferase
MARVWSYLYVIPLIAIATIGFAVTGTVVSWFDSDPRKQNWLERAWSNTLLWITGVTVRVEGAGNLQPDTNYVLVCNHVSYLDTPAVLGKVPVHFRFLAKAELFKIPFMGWHLARSGHVSVPLEDVRGSLKSLSRAAQLMQTGKLSLWIFPEGGRTETGELQEFKDGAAYLAIKGKSPVVPMALLGIGKCLPMGSLTFRRGNVRLRIGKPIPTAGLKLSDRAELTKAMRDQIATMLAS